MWFLMRVSSAIIVADVLGADRDLEAEQLLDREHEAVLHAHRRAVIEPVEVGQRLGVGLVLDQLLGAAVEQADMRVDPLDDLAVQLHDQAKHAVRRRVLRPEVDRVVVDLLVAGVARVAEFVAERLAFAAAPTLTSTVRAVGPGAGVGHASPFRSAADFGLVGRRRFADFARRLGRARLARLLLGLGVGGLAARRSRPACRSSWASRPGFSRSAAPARGRRRRRRRARRLAGRLLVAGQHDIPALPTASGSRRCGSPAAAPPAHRPRASRLRNSAARHGRSAGSPCAADSPRSHSR